MIKVNKKLLFNIIRPIIIIVAIISLIVSFNILEEEAHEAEHDVDHYIIDEVLRGTFDQNDQEYLRLVEIAEQANIDLGYNKFLTYTIIIFLFYLIYFIYLYIGNKYVYNHTDKKVDQSFNILGIIIILIQALISLVIISNYPKAEISSSYILIIIVNSSAIILIIFVYYLYKYLISKKLKS